MGRNNGILDDHRNAYSTFRFQMSVRISLSAFELFVAIFSGEELKLSPQTKVVFETNQINDVSPGFISKCGLVITEKNELAWTVFLDDW